LYCIVEKLQINFKGRLLRRTSMDGSVNLGQRDGEIYFYLICLGGDPGMEGIILNNTEKSVGRLDSLQREGVPVN